MGARQPGKRSATGRHADTTAAAETTPAIAPGNARLIDAFDRHLATRATNTRVAYLRDVRALAQLAGTADLRTFRVADVRRCLSTLHGRGLEGRSLARMLSAWRGFYRFLQERNGVVAENP